MTNTETAVEVRDSYLIEDPIARKRRWLDEQEKLKDIKQERGLLSSEVIKLSVLVSELQPD